MLFMLPYLLGEEKEAQVSFRALPINFMMLFLECSNVLYSACADFMCSDEIWFLAKITA